MKGKNVIEWIALAVSALALLFSAVTFWRTEIKPYILVVPPPALTQANDDLPSLILDLALQNEGGASALVTDVRLRAFSHGKALSVPLHAQKILGRTGKYSKLPLGEATVAGVFLPFAIKPSETIEKRLYMAPYESDLPIREGDVLAVDVLALDLFLDGKWQNLYFLPYADYHLKFKGAGVFEVPENGFSPRWYPEQDAVRVTGSRRLFR